MKLTTRSRYGLRAINYLALHDDEAPVAISTLSRDLLLSENYLEQLLRLLKEGNIVDSYRGKYGGYKIVRPFEKITVKEILLALEGDLSSSDCNKNDKCTDYDCIAKDIFFQIDQAVDQVVSNITVRDMIQRQ